MSTSNITTTSLDVRPILAAGGEPFEQILAAAADVPMGGTLDLLAPFDPVPLYGVLQARGFSALTAVETDGSVRVRFTQTGIGASTTLAEVAALDPRLELVLGAHGMDTCCGGPKTLEFAARAHGVDLNALLTELHAGAAGATSM